MSGLHEHGAPAPPSLLLRLQRRAAAVCHLVVHQPGVRDHDVRVGGVPLHAHRAQDHSRQHGGDSIRQDGAVTRHTFLNNLDAKCDLSFIFIQVVEENIICHKCVVTSRRCGCAGKFLPVCIGAGGSWWLCTGPAGARITHHCDTTTSSSTDVSVPLCHSVTP